MCANWPFNTPPLLMCGCLPPPSAVGTVPPAGRSPRRQREPAASQGQPPSKSAANQAWRDPAMATRLVPLQKSSLLFLVHPVPPPNSLALFFSPPPTKALLLLPKSCCPQQRWRHLRLSVYHSRRHTHLPTHTHTHTNAGVASTISLLAARSLVPCIPSRSFPLFPTLYVTSHTPGPLPARAAHHLASKLLFLTALHKHRALA